MAPEPVEHKLAAILSADAVGYSRLMADDEAATIRTLSSYREQIGVLVREHRGRVVDSPGDNVLAEFPAAIEALRCAMEMQGVLRARNASLPAERRMDFRIGVHMGDVATDGERVYGDGVNIAARLEGLADAGGVCISGTVHEQVRNKLDVGFTDLGEQAIKNIPDPVRVYRIDLQGARESAAPARPSGTLRPVLAGAGALLFLLAVGLWAVWPAPLGLVLDLTGAGAPPVDPPLPDKPSLVVLPFANMSDDPEQEYFSDGITEDLTTELSHSSSLFVIARNSAFTYKHRDVSIEDVGRELGVRYVLEGSVRRTGQRLRITAQLVDAQSGLHVWSERYDGDLADVFALQVEIAERIQASVGAEIAGAEFERVRRAPTESLPAYDLWLRGMYHFVRFTRSDNAEARDLAEGVLALDPNFADAYSMRGGTYAQEYLGGWNLDRRLLERASEDARRALALDSNSTWAHILLANVALFSDRPEDAIAAAERVLEIEPNNRFANGTLAVGYAQQGQPLRALRELRRALRLNPRPPAPMLSVMGYVNYAAGRKAEAIAAWERALIVSPERVGPRIPLTWSYELAGRHDKARAMAEEMLRLNPELTTELVLRWIPSGAIADEDELARYAAALRRAGLP